MADAQVPPEGGDAKATSARRQALRLSDAENVATVRLDMFGDPALKEALAGPAPPPGDAASPGAMEAAGEPPRHADAALDAAEAGATAEPPAGGLPPALHLPPPDAVPGSDATADPSEETPEQPPPEHDAAPVTSVPSADAEPFPPPDALEAPQEAPGGDGNAPGPFGAPFMMPPGSSERDGLASLTTGPVNEQPRFRDELMFVRDTDGMPITADSTILANMEPSPPPEPPPSETASSEAAPLYEPEPEFMEPPEPLPEEPPAAPSFPLFSVVSPHPEADTGFGEAPLQPEPEPPPIRQLHLDAAARIAAEASATAAALENLERLLEQKRPDLHVVAPPPYSPDPFLEHSPPPQTHSPGFEMQGYGIAPEPPAFRRPPDPALLLPLPVRPRSNRGIYVVGFLAGLAISLMAGLVLYFFILQAGTG